MNVKLQHRLLQSFSAGLIAGTLWAAVWAFLPLNEPEQAIPLDTTPTGAAAVAQTNDQAQSPVDLALAIQKPLYDPPKVVAKPSAPARVVQKPVVRPPAKPKLDWTLIGTIIEPNKRVAIISDASGKTVIRSEGEAVALSPTGARVASIASNKVTLEIDGQQASLKLRKASPTSDSDSDERPNRRRNR
ncbi:hypothetical protein LOC67_02765 [Stieleria sp. JC731]|uniref:hypothetical protein n=1 Tax=Pirellulaceae TaxID=2691357 RepID=UPI001E42E450|nr:hypothetical protein [Stieleria sp. JC731]MCC9599468.1 hypothetical protein [Stieleria sp. JC731]